MRFQFTNIGKVKEADVIINGLTVITGTNDSGKSTIAKTLYGIINGVKNIKPYYENQIYDIISRNLNQIQNRLDNNINYVMDMGKNNETKITSRAHTYLKNDRITKLLIQKNRTMFEKYQDDVLKYLDVSDIDPFVKEIEEAINYSSDDIEIKKLSINKGLALELDNQINNLFSEENASLKIDYDTNVLSLNIKNNVVERIDKINSIYTENLIYIETPLIFNDFKKNNVRFIEPDKLRNHTDNLLEYLFQFSIKPKQFTIDQIINKEKYELFNEIFSNMLNGSFSYSKERKEFVLVREGKEIGTSNTAMGIKAIALIQILLDNGFFKKDNMLMIDEPEVHLHPIWQIEYARIIVLLIKEFGVNIIITSHSPFFIEALEKFSDLYKIKEITNFYYMENSPLGSTTTHINKNMGYIYKKLSGAYDRLDDYYFGDR